MARLESWEVRDGGLGPAGDRSAGPGRRGERRIIRLADCVSVLPADGESCPRDTGAFLLTTTERSHLLAAEHRQAWMGPICQLAFPVSTGQVGKASRGGPGRPFHHTLFIPMLIHIPSLSKHLEAWDTAQKPTEQISDGHACYGEYERLSGTMNE